MMNHSRPSDVELLEAMEACRPGSDDLAEADMALLAAAMAGRRDLEDRFARLQKADVAIAGAIQDVAVPGDLGSRLFSQIPPNVRVNAVGRRRALAWSLCGIAALLLVGVASWALWPSQSVSDYTPMAVLEEAIGFFERTAPGSGTELSQTAPPEAFAFSRFVRPGRSVLWHSIDGMLNEKGVAYEWAGASGSRAVLYVFQVTVAGVAGEPPQRPMHGTGNCAASVWHEGGLLYVLVVRGGQPAYLENLIQPEGEIAIWMPARSSHSA